MAYGWHKRGRCVGVDRCVPCWDGPADLSCSVLTSEFPRVEPLAHATDGSQLKLGTEGM